MDNAAAGICYASDNGANVINMSFGGYVFSASLTLESAIGYAYAKDSVLVAAAGNDGLPITRTEVWCMYACLQPILNALQSLLPIPQIQ